jgi:hypothetical protein
MAKQKKQTGDAPPPYDTHEHRIRRIEKLYGVPHTIGGPHGHYSDAAIAAELEAEANGGDDSDADATGDEGEPQS